MPPSWRVSVGERPAPAGRLHLGEQERMVSRLDAEDEVHAVLDQVPHVGAVAGQAVLHDDQFQAGMLPANLLQQPSGRIALAVVFGAAVLFLNRLRRQRNHLLEIGVDEHRGEHLMFVGHRAVLVLLHLARWTVNLLRREVSGAIQRQQVAAVVELEGFQGFAALQLAKHVAKGRPQVFGVQGIEDFPRLRVAGNLPDAEQRLQVGIVAPLVEGQQRRVFQREHGEGRQQRIPQGNGWLELPMVGDSGKALAQQGIQGIGRQLLANLPGTGRRGEDHGDSFRLEGRTCSSPAHDSRFEPLGGDRLSTGRVYENASAVPPVFTGFLDRRELLSQSDGFWAEMSVDRFRGKWFGLLLGG